MFKRITLILSVLLASAATAQTPAGHESLKADISFIVTNDNGRNGYYDQKPVAATMGQIAEETEPEAVLALGDVFHYQGVQSVSDPIWISNFESIYTHPELMVEWLPICGNHEYRGNTQAVVDYSGISRRWEMPSKYYSRSFKEKTTSIKIVFLDTTPLIDKYREDPEDYPDAAKEDMEAQLQWLDNELTDVAEDWVVVVGHHPIYAHTSKNEKERTDMQNRVDRILRQHKVDMYICGHIHNFQHIRLADSGIDYVVNSSASLSREKVENIEGTVFTSGKSGFSVLGVSAGKLTLSMIDRDGNILHQVNRSKDKK